VKKGKPCVRHFGCLAAAVAGVCFSLVPSTFASVVNLGSAGNYAVVGVGGTVAIQSDFEIYQSATVINGNVAEGPYTTLTHGIDATVNGRWDYDATDLPAPPSLGSGGTVTGGFVQKNMSTVSSDAISASTTAHGLAATMSLDTLANGDVITLASGLNVIQINHRISISGGGSTLTLNGQADSSVVFQLLSSGEGVDLNFSGTTMILNGITPGNIVWNLDGLSAQKNDVTISSGATVYGIFLAPQRNVVIDHGHVTGAVIGGGQSSDPGLSIHSSSTIDWVVPVPEPATFLVGALLLLPFGASTIRMLRRKTAV
jgi:choice-of-anchor A domain-containing protein